MAVFQRIKTPFPQVLPEAAVAMLGPRSAGEALRERREALDLDLAEIAATLRIKPAYLSALEEGRPDRLPGPVYAVGFVRAYSEHLGLDSEEILRRFRLETSGLSAKPDLSFPMPLGERSVPGGGMLLVALILAICGYGTWYYLSTAERTRPERVSEMPAELAPPNLVPQPVAIPQPVAADAMPPMVGAAAVPDRVGTTGTATVSGPGPAAVPARAPATAAPPATGDATALTLPALAATGVSPAAAPPAAAGSSASPQPAPPSASDTQSEAGRVYGETTGPVRIVMRATADSWVQVRDADQSPLFTRLLKAGDIYRVPDRAGASMRVGNAGGLEITVDGKTTPPLGPTGAVRRDVALDPEALMAGTAVRQ